MKERVLTGSMIFLITIFAILARVFSVYVFDAFILGVMLFASIESSKLFAKMKLFNNKKIVFAFPLALYALFLILLNQNTGIVWAIASVLALIVGFGLITFVLSLIFKSKTENEIATRKFKGGKTMFSANKAMHTLLSMLYPTIGLFFFILFNHFSSIVEIAPTVENKELIGLVGILLVFAITSATDIFSLLFGKAFGKRPLAKKISPNKTVEGTIGGFVFAILIALFTFILLGAFETFSSLFYNIGLNVWNVILLSAIGSLVSVAGDLFESFLKRKANTKNSSNFLPGHGGFLDRFDSHTFNVVWVFLFFLLFL